jgi:hypothetical protein
MLVLVCFDRLGQDEEHLRTAGAQSFGQAVTGGTQPAADVGRKFPAEHENTHETSPFGILECERATVRRRVKTPADGRPL